MELKEIKENATIEELNEWIIDAKEKFNILVYDYEEKAKRENELLEANQKMFLKLTNNMSKNEEEKEEEKIPSCVNKVTYDILSSKEKELLQELIESEE